MDPPSSSAPSSAFHSAPQSPSSALLDSPLPSLHQLSAALPADSPFADPPISATTLPPPAWYSVKHLPDESSCRRAAAQSLDLSPRVRSCDVYVGHCTGTGRRAQSQKLRFVRWLRAELEMHGVSCFVSDRRQCGDAQAHAAALVAMGAATLGVVVVSRKSFSNPYAMEEIRAFLVRKKLVPVFFGLTQAECTARDIIEKRGEVWELLAGKPWAAYGGSETEWREAVDGLAWTDVKVQVNGGNMRDAVLEAVVLVGMKLGRRGIVEKVADWKEMVAVEEYPFPRNCDFVGRKKELLELEFQLFGAVEGERENQCIDARSRNQHSSESRGGSSSGIMDATVGEVDIGKSPMASVKLEEEIAFQGLSRPQMSGGEAAYKKGVACISGDFGMGKTELLLEFAYRFGQRYKKVLWVGGEARYLRLNYMKLLPLLGVDVNIENELYPKKNPVKFEDIEEEKIRRIKRELMRDIPFLLVIDNLESEKDWWDGRNIMEILPQFNGQTHVLISTRLPHVVDIKPLRLLHFSSAEAMSLMTGNSTGLPNEDLDALRVLEEKLGQLPLGLALVRAILSELPLDAAKVLDMINQASFGDFIWNGKEDVTLRRNPFLMQLLDLCFSIFDHADKTRKLTRMLQASAYFAPSMIPISLLTLAAHGISEQHNETHVWRKVLRAVSCMCITTNASNSEAEVSTMLVRFRVARSTTKIGYIHIHDVVRLYAQKRGDVTDACAVVQAISKEGSLPYNSDHVLAACFLLFKFGTVPAVINLAVLDLMSFIKCRALPLAIHIFRAFSQCNTSLEILRLSTETLELVEDTFLSDDMSGSKKSSSSKRPSSGSSIQSDPHIYQEFAHLRATLLETRASIMLTGGIYDVAEQLNKTALSIKEVIFGWEHPETVATRQALEKLIRIQSIF